MNRLTATVSIFALVGMLSACNDNDGNSVNTNFNNDNLNEHTTTDNNTENNLETNDDNNHNNDSKKHSEAVDNNDKVTEQMSDLNIKDIEIEVKYNNDQEYEAEIDLKSDGAYTSELDDDLNNIYLNGQEAFDNIYSMAEKLDLSADSSKEEVFEQVLKAFGLDNDYKKIEMEITFHDSNKSLEYEEKK